MPSVRVHFLSNYIWTKSYLFRDRRSNAFFWGQNIYVQASHKHCIGSMLRIISAALSQFNVLYSSPKEFMLLAENAETLCLPMQQAK